MILLTVINTKFGISNLLFQAINGDKQLGLFCVTLNRSLNRAHQWWDQSDVQMNHLVWFVKRFTEKNQLVQELDVALSTQNEWWFQSKQESAFQHEMLKIWAFVHILVCTESYVDMEWWILCVCQKQRLFFLWSLSEWSVCSSNCLSAPNTHTHMLYFVCWNSSVSVHPFASHYPIALPLSHTHTHTHTHTHFIFPCLRLPSLVSPSAAVFLWSVVTSVTLVVLCEIISKWHMKSIERQTDTHTHTHRHTHADTDTHAHRHTHTDRRTHVRSKSIIFEWLYTYFIKNVFIYFKFYIYKKYIKIKCIK